MKFNNYAFAAVSVPCAVLMSSCVAISVGPVGSWQGMDGTDVVTLNLNDDGSMLMNTPAQSLRGSWTATAPGRVVIVCYHEGVLVQMNDNQARFTFNNKSIILNRVAPQASPQTNTPRTANKPEAKAAPKSPPAAGLNTAPKSQVLKKESYYLNQIP